MRLILCMCLALLPAVACSGDVVPDDTLEGFYRWVLEGQEGGPSLPSAKGRHQLSAFMEPRLIDLLENASRAEEFCEKAVAGTTDKPNMFEGDIFTASWEHADEVSYGATVRKEDRASNEVRFVSINTHFPKADPSRSLTCEHKVSLRRNGKRWLIETTFASMLKKYIKACS